MGPVSASMHAGYVNKLHRHKHCFKYLSIIREKGNGYSSSLKVKEVL